MQGGICRLCNFRSGCGPCHSYPAATSQVPRHWFPNPFPLSPQVWMLADPTGAFGKVTPHPPNPCPAGGILLMDQDQSQSLPTHMSVYQSLALPHLTSSTAQNQGPHPLASPLSHPTMCLSPPLLLPYPLCQIQLWDSGGWGSGTPSPIRGIQDSVPPVPPP